MTCKCDKDKFKEELSLWFRNELSKHLLPNITEHSNGEFVGTIRARNKFNELWKEHMED